MLENYRGTSPGVGRQWLPPPSPSVVILMEEKGPVQCQQMAPGTVQPLPALGRQAVQVGGGVVVAHSHLSGGREDESEREKGRVWRRQWHNGHSTCLPCERHAWVRVMGIEDRSKERYRCVRGEASSMR